MSVKDLLQIDEIDLNIPKPRVSRSKPTSRGAYNVSGKSVSDILSISSEDINRMSRKELASVTSRLVSVANKRIKRAKQSGISEISPAYVKDRKEFSVKGKNVGQLKNEYKKLKNFLTLETSSQIKTETSKGFRQFKKGVESRIGTFRSESEEKKFWKAYRKLEEEKGGSSAIRSLYGSSEVQTMLHQNIVGNDGRRSVDNIISSMESDLDNLYIKKLMESGDFYSLTDEDYDFEL